MNTRAQPPFPPNPQPGQKWGAWTWTGSRWACTRLQGTFINVQVFVASAPYTPTPGLLTALVECVGGGGAGGYVVPSGGPYAAAGGGGSGGYSRAALAATLVVGGVNVTVGQGGVSAIGSNPSGVYGGTTSFGSLCYANGGGNAGAYDPTGLGSHGNPGVAATGGIGDIAFRGASGFEWSTVVIPAGAPTPGTYAQAGLGGFGGFGGNEGAPAAFGGSGNGLAGAPYSGAGGGGAVSNNGASFIGGAGGSGICIVTETCWADTGDDGCGCGPTGGQARVAAWPGGFDDDC